MLHALGCRVWGLGLMDVGLSVYGLGLGSGLGLIFLRMTVDSLDSAVTASQMHARIPKLLTLHNPTH